MADFIQFTIQGLTIGSIYGIIALGITLAFNASGAVSLAQGYFAILGVTIGFSLVNGYNMPMGVAIVLSIVLAFGIGLFQERLTIRPILGTSVSTFLIITIGFSRFQEGVIKEIWGTDIYSLPPIFATTRVEWFGVGIATQSILIFCVLIGISLFFYYLFSYTSLGKAMRAVAEDRNTSQMFGINAAKLNFWIFGAGGALGALGGILMSPISFVTYDFGNPLGLKAMIAAIIGGITNPFGAIVGGLILGLGEAYGVGYFSSLFKDLIAYGILFAFLVIRSMTVPKTFLESRHSEFKVAVEKISFSRTTSRAIMAVIAVIAVLFPFVSAQYFIGIVILILIYFVLALILDVLFGFSGLLSLGQAMFMGIGAYGSAILIMKAGFSPIAAMFTAMLISAIAAWLVAISTLRLSGFEFAVATIAINFVFYSVVLGWQNLTGGGIGISQIPEFSLLGISFKDRTAFYFLILACAVLIGWGAYNLTRSRTGRALRIIKSDIRLASALGIYAVRYKVMIFVLGSAATSIIGSLYAHFIGYISPGQFSVTVSLTILLMVILGGLGTLWGPLFGVAIIQLLPEMLGEYQEYIYIVQGILIMILLIFLPGGLTGLFGKIISRFMRKNPDQSRPTRENAYDRE